MPPAIRLRFRAITSSKSSDTLDAGARLRFDTGPVSHRTALQVSRYRDVLSRGIISSAPILSNIYHPVDRPKPYLPAGHAESIRK
jgi:hypothetical protein